MLCHCLSEQLVDKREQQITNGAPESEYADAGMLCQCLSEEMVDKREQQFTIATPQSGDADAGMLCLLSDNWSVKDSSEAQMLLSTERLCGWWDALRLKRVNGR
jgi:hypothetical protein